MSSPPDDAPAPVPDLKAEQAAMSSPPDDSAMAEDLKSEQAQQAIRDLLEICKV
jgi:hypothetical protein